MGDVEVDITGANKKSSKKKIIITCMMIIVLIIVVVGAFWGIKEHNYQKAIMYRKNGEYAEAINLFKRIGVYKDTAKLLHDTNNDYLLQLTEAKSFDQAYKFASENNVVGSEELANLKRLQYLEEGRFDSFINAEEGDSFFFGTYMQGKSGEMEPVEWVVLDRQYDKMLVITAKCLEYDWFGGNNWVESRTREMLNSSMFNQMFSTEEKTAVLTTTVHSDLRDTYDFDKIVESFDSEDKLFLLSEDEVLMYMPTYTSRYAPATSYCYDSELSEPMWMTRTTEGSYAQAENWEPNSSTIYTKCVVITVLADKDRAAFGSAYTGDERYIRPAMWLSIDKDYK